MGDINRVFTHIDAFIDSGGGLHLDILSKVIVGTCIEGAKRGYTDRDMEDEDFVAQIDAAEYRLNELAKSNSTDLEDLKTSYRDAATEAMACRRTVLPLVPQDRPWITLDPRETLFDDDDQYSFAVYDTLADEVAKLLPELEQIACEVAWDPNDPPKLGIDWDSVTTPIDPSELP